MSTEDIISINPLEVKFLIHRDREAEGFKRLKEAIREIGVRQPLHVADISHWPTNKRRRPDGRMAKWLAAFGEGRCTASVQIYEETQDKRYLAVPAIEKKLSEVDTVSPFLSENILRRGHPWIHQARLVKTYVDAEIEAGRKPDIKAIARAHFIEPGHAAKLLHILKESSPRIARELEGLNLRQAASLITLPVKGQEIVIETLAEADLDKSQIETVIKKARRVMEETGELSKSALQASIKRVDEDLERMRERLKLYRLHHSLGPENLAALLKKKNFRAEMDRKKINYGKFLEEVK